MQENVLSIILFIWGLLIFASILVYTIKKLNPQKDYRELASRTKSWWYMIGIFTIVNILKAPYIYIFWGIVSFIALKEFFTMIQTRRADRRVLFWAYLSIIAQYYFVATHWYGMFIIFIPVYMFLFIALRLVITQETDGFLKSSSIINWGLMICVFSLSHASLLYSFPEAINSEASGPGLLLYLIFLTQFNDVAQYVWGKLFGKHKIIEKVSPKKTWEGFIGGVITTCVFAYFFAPLITPYQGIHVLYTALIISIGGFFGDVTISALKRDLGVKDAGNIIPGHGGILDRIDSLVFTAPLILHFTRYFYY